MRNLVYNEGESPALFRIAPFRRRAQGAFQAPCHRLQSDWMNIHSIWQK